MNSVRWFFVAIFYANKIFFDFLKRNSILASRSQAVHYVENKEKIEEDGSIIVGNCDIIAR